MALTLLDYLFDRETQAASNLSGLGKHGKKQLDPLFIFGIRCEQLWLCARESMRLDTALFLQCRPPEQTFRRDRAGLAPHQAEHGLQVSHGFQTQATGVATRCQSLPREGGQSCRSAELSTSKSFVLY